MKKHNGLKSLIESKWVEQMMNKTEKSLDKVSGDKPIRKVFDSTPAEPVEYFDDDKLELEDVYMSPYPWLTEYVTPPTIEEMIAGMNEEDYKRLQYSFKMNRPVLCWVYDEETVLEVKVVMIHYKSLITGLYVSGTARGDEYEYVLPVKVEDIGNMLLEQIDVM